MAACSRTGLKSREARVGLFLLLRAPLHKVSATRHQGRLGAVMLIALSSGQEPGCNHAYVSTTRPGRTIQDHGAVDMGMFACRARRAVTAPSEHHRTGTVPERDHPRCPLPSREGAQQCHRPAAPLPSRRLQPDRRRPQPSTTQTTRVQGARRLASSEPTSVALAR